MSFYSFQNHLFVVGVLQKSSPQLQINAWNRLIIRPSSPPWTLKEEEEKELNQYH